MDNERINTEPPQIFLKTITFNDGTQLPLDHNSIIVFTGANNCGKSQVLKDLEEQLNQSREWPTVVVKDAEYDYFGEIDDAAFLKDRFFRTREGYYQPYNSGAGYTKESLVNTWNSHSFYNGFHLLFVKRLSTELRLTVSNGLDRCEAPENHPIFMLYKNELLAQKISGYFHQAFGVDLVVNRTEMRTIPLHIGQAPDMTAYTIDKQDDYYKQVAALPKLQDQGDGMRSYASILLDTFTSNYSMTMIDEPEAFLHPPQARLLGKMLAKNNPDGRQLFISTHSEDFLQGLLDADSSHVTVVRIDRADPVNRMSILENSRIQELWGNPILRYSNILSGLFHEKVIVCESDYDCLFYQAVIDAMYEARNEIAPDVLFTHCGGKSRVKDVVKALRAVNVPVAAICDFDLLNQKPEFKPLAEAFGLDWEAKLSADMKTVYDAANASPGTWNWLKTTGKTGFQGGAPAAYEKVERVCQSAGLFVVPVGEMECFDKTVSKKKKEWVYHVITQYKLAEEPKLGGAQQFIQSVVDFRPSV